ncbi:unknown [Ruminococcus sp. CAG:254]|nr:unknown [Ruminococcus sp. CAG:254]
MWESSFVCLLLFDSWETDCVWFGKIASLFARVCKLLLGIPPESGFGKAGAHPQLAWETAIAPETLHLITAFLFQKAIAVSAILS